MQLAFIVRRLVASIILLVLVSLFSFYLIVLAPGDALAESHINPRASASTIAAIRHRYGLDLPAHRRYLNWMAGLSRGDAGFSFVYDSPVADLVLPRLGNTLLLSVAAYLLAWLIGLPLGIFAAVTRRRWVDRIIYSLATAGISMPRIFLALVGLLVAARTSLFPIGGMLSLGHDEMGFLGRTSDVTNHLLLPALVLCLYPLALYLMQIRSSLSEALTKEYVRTAMAKGLPESRVVLRHALRNAVNPLITLFGFSFGNLLGGAALVETIMAWPGMGKLTVDAVFARDAYVVLAGVMASSAMLIIGNFLSELLLARSDPRIRSGD